METNNIQTRKDEIRFFTNKPEEMLGKYLAKRLLRTWQEDFVDNDTGEVVSIDRNEIIADRGQLITGDLLAVIRFHLQSGDISEVEVSNQKREGISLDGYYMYCRRKEEKISFICFFYRDGYRNCM